MLIFHGIGAHGSRAKTRLYCCARETRRSVARKHACAQLLLMYAQMYGLAGVEDIDYVLCDNGSNMIKAFSVLADDIAPEDDDVDELDLGKCIECAYCTLY